MKLKCECEYLVGNTLYINFILTLLYICLRVLSVLSGLRKCPAEGGGVRRVEELPKIWLSFTMSDACSTVG